MKICLDLFCGMGGWSIGFYREGYTCIGIDIVDVGYPYTLILEDIHNFHPNPNIRADVIVASPPCTEFSVLTNLSVAAGRRLPKDPLGEKGIGLVKEAIRVIHETEPRFWILENVKGSIPYISPLLGQPVFIAGAWVLWGNIPKEFFDDLKVKTTKKEYLDAIGGNLPFDPLASWKRSRIPIWLSQHIAKKIILKEKEEEERKTN
jgi:site-specific DNA-cytosine methylase